MQLLSVNVSQPGPMIVGGRSIRSSIGKRPLQTSVEVGALGLEGDGRATVRKLGEEHHAVSFYASEHYEHWRSVQCRPEFSFGSFGENLTTSGVLESDTRIGDVFRCGSALLQVAQPRLPCRKWRQVLGLDSSRPILESRRLGFYCRVLEPGSIEAPGCLERIDTDPESATVDEFVRISQFDSWDEDGLARLLRCRDLMPAWKTILEEKLELARKAEGWLGFRELEVHRREHESDDVLSLHLRCPNRRPLAAFRAGQFVMLAIRPLPGLPVLRRPYFLSNESSSIDSYRISVRKPTVVDPERVLGLVSSHLHEQLDLGSRVRVSAPRGGFTLDRVGADCDRLVLVSSGIGVAAVVAFLHEAVARRPELPVTALHVATDGRHHPFAERLRTLVESRPNYELSVAFQKPGKEDVLGSEFQRSGVFDQGDLVRSLRSGLESVLICGSRSFVREIRQGYGRAGLAFDRIHVEEFEDGRTGQNREECEGST